MLAFSLQTTLGETENTENYVCGLKLRLNKYDYV